MTIAQQNASNGLTLKAYQGDAKTLLAFNLPKPKTKGLAGFTVQYTAGGQGPYYLHNSLRFADPSKHVQDASQSPNSSLNAPIHKFRWIHVPGSLNQSTDPFFGPYTYTVTPRYFDAEESLQAIDPSLGVSLTIDVGPFQHDTVGLGFARGFTQSQAFVHHFGPKPLKRPSGLLYDTSQPAGKNSQGQAYTYADQYKWLGFTARARVFDLANEVLANPALTLDVFAYDLNVPDLLEIFLSLAKQGRMRMILDNATLHHDPKKPKLEDQFEQQFRAVATGSADILRGKFSRFAHDKEFIVRDATGPLKVLTGSTNFSVTGLYVNANHVLVFNDRTVATAYADVFDQAWLQKVNGPAFAKSPAASKKFSFDSDSVPPTDVTYSPHSNAFATEVLQGLADRIALEGKTKNGSVLFAVMDIGVKNTGPVFPALRDLHTDEDIFSYGITDTTDGIALYKPGTTKGILVTGKPAHTMLPPPFDQVPGVGLGHQVHHKFVVCGFNTANAVVFCGSSNLALGGEQANGDNLIAIRDRDIATVFAIEALGLVEHFHFLDGVQTAAKQTGQVAAKATPAATAAKTKSASKMHQASAAGWHLSTTDQWVRPYYDSKDLHYVDRLLFGG